MMGGSRFVVALGDFIVVAPFSGGEARALLSLLRVLYIDYLGAYRDYRGVIVNVGKFLRRLTIRIVREFGIRCEEGSALRPCLVIYDVGLDLPPMVFRVGDDAYFEDILREVIRRAFISFAGDVHVGAFYVYREGGRLRVGNDYFKAVVEGDRIYIEDWRP
ncbi:hypothetical protein JCM14467A_11600 [Vulcanisaeta sp. JCM 14467]